MAIFNRYVKLPEGISYPVFTETFSGWWLSHPSEKYESPLGLLFPIYGKIKNGRNHQPASICAGVET